MPKLKWYGVMPKRCDLCKRPLTKFFADGRTRMGPWAIMCHHCFREYGVKLGTGKGQKYSIPGGQKIE